MFIAIMYVIFYLRILVNIGEHILFIQRTEQVLIKLDISAIDDYVIMMSISLTHKDNMPCHLVAKSTMYLGK